MTPIPHSPTGRRLAYEKLIDKARTMPIPKDIPLKNPSSFHLLGTSPPRIDEPDIVTGKARYGMDIRLPDMVFAAVVQCPFAWFNATGQRIRRLPIVPEIG